MNIAVAANPPASLPLGRSRNNKYAAIFEAIAQTPDWYTVPASEITGATNHQKQRALHAAAFFRTIKIQTAVRNDILYVRRRPEA